MGLNSKGKRPTPIEAKSDPAKRRSPVAVTAGGSDILLNPSQVSAAAKAEEEAHRAEREAARAPVSPDKKMLEAESAEAEGVDKKGEHQ